MPSKKDELSQRDSNQIASGVTGVGVDGPLRHRSVPNCRCEPQLKGAVRG
jgi:hypothetical protein